MLNFREREIQTVHPEYFGLCQLFGTPMQVAIRRETSDIKEIFESCSLREEFQRMNSGSRREGFRLKGSDYDIMKWPTNHRVIWFKSMSQRYTDKHTLLQSDSSESPPGFTLLKMLRPEDSSLYLPVSKVVVGSCEFRRHTRQFIIQGSREHGPCHTTVHHGTELDWVTCLACDSWPPSASSWITRSRSLSWPIPEMR